jgi:hypothetical protein
VDLSLSAPNSTSTCIIQVLAATFAVCSLLSLIGARGKHFLELPRFSGQVNAFGDRVEEVPPFEVYR